MNLNYRISKIDNTKTDKCETCNKKETIIHYIYDCKKFDTERNLLEKETEDVLKEFGLHKLSSTYGKSCISSYTRIVRTP